MSANDNAAGNDPRDVNDSEVSRSFSSNQQPGRFTALDLTEIGPGSVHEAACHRRVLILRGLPATIPAEEIVNALESYPEAPKLTNITFAGNCHWYLMFENEKDAREANFILNGDIKKICNTPIKACFKHSMPLFQQKQVMESKFRQQQIMSAPASHVPSPTPPYAPVSHSFMGSIDMKPPTGIIPTATALNHAPAMFSQIPGHFISSAYPFPAAFNLSTFGPQAAQIFAESQNQGLHHTMVAPIAIQLQGQHQPHLIQNSQMHNLQQPLKLHSSRLLEQHQRKRASSVQTMEPRNLSELYSAYSLGGNAPKTLIDSHQLQPQHHWLHHHHQQQHNTQRFEDEFPAPEEADTPSNTILESKIFTSSKFNQNDITHEIPFSLFNNPHHHQQQQHRDVETNRSMDILNSSKVDGSIFYNRPARRISVNNQAQPKKILPSFKPPNPSSSTQSRKEDNVENENLRQQISELAVQKQSNKPQIISGDNKLGSVQSTENVGINQQSSSRDDITSDRGVPRSYSDTTNFRHQRKAPENHISYAGKLKTGLSYSPHNQQQQQQQQQQRSSSNRNQQRSTAAPPLSGRR